MRWEKVVPPRQKNKYTPHIIQIKTTFLDQEGNLVDYVKHYEEWLGVCTNNIKRVIQNIQLHFPNCPVRYTYLQHTRKILPYFESRLLSGKLEAANKPFYKVYVQGVTVHDVGKLCKKHKISYYAKEDWLVRLYIDLGVKFNSQGFYYKWYTVDDSSQWLLKSFQMHPEITAHPDFIIGAFDLETVPMDGGYRIPTGENQTDEIVMVSLIKWSKSYGVRKYLFYRTPCPLSQKIEMDRTFAYTSEAAMLSDFHLLIEDCHVLTGYNINGFDIPCIFSRLTWLGMRRILRHYSSSNVGQSLVTAYQNKIVIDLYHFYKVFAKYDLPGYKLDDVVRIKLNEAKDPVNATGIWYWYTQPLTESLVHSNDAEECYNALKPKRINVHQFGTFKEYMRYCFKDSWLVYKLFEQEMVLNFFIERANFTALNAIQALYMGNSRFLLELFKSYGTLLGFFFNAQFMKSPVNPDKYDSVYIIKNKKKTYQGALNYCLTGRAFDDVSVMDFTSMYPSALVNCNLCFGTCTILTRDEWSNLPYSSSLVAIPYRKHGPEHFLQETEHVKQFEYPPLDNDSFVIVCNTQAEAFLPRLVKHFITLRKNHQKQYKSTKDVYHYNAQLCIKLLINSLYGVMANKDSCLYYLPIAMTIVTLARYQLLGSYHYLKRLGFTTCYADTDSLMVERWPLDNCDAVNEFLNLNHVELKYEKRMKRLVVLQRKRYVHETQDGNIVTKGFQKLTNELVEFITDLVLTNVWHFLFKRPIESKIQLQPENIVSNSWLETFTVHGKQISLESRGWLIWVEIVQKAHYKCRQVDKYSIYRKTKHLHEYKSKTCAAVRMLEKYPEKANDYIEYTYSRADVAEKEASKWVMDASECQQVNYEQLFISQKKTFCHLLNLAFWKRPDIPIKQCDMVLNNLRWKQFMHVELMHYKATKRRIMILVEPKTRYTFRINDHLFCRKRGRGRLPKRKGDQPKAIAKKKMTL